MTKYVRMLGREEGGNTTSLRVLPDFAAEAARQGYIFQQDPTRISRAGCNAASGTTQNISAGKPKDGRAQLEI